MESDSLSTLDIEDEDDENIGSFSRDAEPEEEDTIPIPLTQAKGKSLTTLHLEYINDLPEYPESHIHGHTYVVPAGMRSQAEMEQMVHDVSN
ncbi:hypothetical protein BDW60DRAFT_197484 [Aspergillus nidulans var. acristatus]